MTTASAHDRTAVVDTVVAAFHADPAFRYFFADAGAFDQQAAAFAGYLFDRRVGRGGVWIAEGGASVAMWDPPSGNGSAPALELELPPDALGRIEVYERMVDSKLPKAPHWYLGVLATRPDRQGRGCGRAVMASGLRAAAAAGMPAYLETTNPANVDLYRRIGWEPTASVAVADLTVWIMSYPPGPG